MADVYGESFCHLVWATTRREAMIGPSVEGLLYSYIRQKCLDAKVFVYALNGMPDHIHLICTIPVSLAVSDFVKLIKGSSSHYASRLTQSCSLRWQRGYSDMTFAKYDVRPACPARGYQLCGAPERASCRQ